MFVRVFHFWGLLMNLKTARFFKGITQTELQSRSGVFQSRISLFEKGYAQPTTKERTRIDEALGITVDWDETHSENY